MRMFSLAVLCSLLLAVGPSRAATDSSVDAELRSVVEKVQTKLKSGQRDEKDLAAEIGEFDAILAKHAKEKTDEVAKVLFMKAMLYIQVFDNEAKGTELLAKLKQDFPGTEAASQVDRVLASIKKQGEAKKIQGALVPGAVFPDFQVQDLAGKPLSVSALKGKVVLVDFWATWCGPCVGELPNVRAIYEKYHGSGFDIIGVSLDKDRVALDAFLKAQNVTWPQYFDGQGWQNQLAQKYGIDSIPATFLLGRDGKIIAKGLRGEALGQAVEKALAGG